MLPFFRQTTLTLACMAALAACAAPKDSTPVQTQSMITNPVATDPFDSIESKIDTIDQTPALDTTSKQPNNNQPLPLNDPKQMPVIRAPATQAGSSTVESSNTEQALTDQSLTDHSTDPIADPTSPSTESNTATTPPPDVSLWTADLINTATWVEGLDKGQYPVYAKAQILLDRSHSSPGAIDGITGRNMLKSIAAFELMQGLPVDGLMDAEVWNRLMLADTSPVMISYTLTDADIKGPYASTPHDYAEQAKMKGLYYGSVTEMLGERFHMDQRFLEQINSGKDFSKVGEQILVADPGPADTRPIHLLIAHKGARELYGFDENHNMIVAYPATIGSDDTPSPSGDVTIKAIAPNPWYGYNPKNFIQGKNMKPLSLPPGPNNPVGSMWIALSKPSYGIHGTPSPSRIDKSRSHGCVRLTNWDAEALAKRIKKGVPVQFRGSPSN